MSHDPIEGVEVALGDTAVIHSDGIEAVVAVEKRHLPPCHCGRPSFAGTWNKPEGAVRCTHCCKTHASCDCASEKPS